jgi:hypothetical protein
VVSLLYQTEWFPQTLTCTATLGGISTVISPGYPIAQGAVTVTPARRKLSGSGARMGLPSSAVQGLSIDAFNAQLKGGVYVAPEASVAAAAAAAAAALPEQRRRLEVAATLESAESFDTSFTHLFELGSSTVSCTVRP